MLWAMVLARLIVVVVGVVVAGLPPARTAEGDVGTNGGGRSHLKLSSALPSNDEPKPYWWVCDLGLDIYLVHLAKAAGRSLEATFSAGCEGVPYVTHLPSAIPHTTMHITHGHDPHVDVKRKFLRAKSDPGHANTTTLLMSILREPVSRVVSAFHTSLGRQPAAVREPPIDGCSVVGHVLVCDDAVDAMGNGSMTLDQFASVPGTDLAMDYQTQFLSDMHGPTNALDAAQRQLLVRRSKQSLEFMDAVLVTDRLNEGFAVLNCMIADRGKKQLAHVHFSSNWNQHPKTDEMSRETKEKLTQRNSLDKAVYAHASELFEKQVQGYRHRPCFQRVIQGLQPCEPKWRYSHKYKGERGSYDLEHAISLLKDSEKPSEFLLRTASCPLF